MSNLIKHAEEELKRAGLFDKDSDYDGMIAPSVMKMIEVFSAKGHSGMSASITLQIFNRLANFKTLTPITDDPSEWMDVSEYGPSPAFQNRRDSTCFSTDGGKTHYSIDDPKREVKKTQAKSS